jgi:hypothetical protein
MAKGKTKARVSGIVPNLFLDVKRKRSKELRLQTLIDGKTLASQIVLKGAFDDRVVWDLPGGAPPDYTPNPLAKKTIEDYEQVLPKFVKGHARNSWADGKPLQESIRRERAWSDMLDELHPDEGAVLIAMVDGTLNKLYNSVCLDLAKEAFPELFPND